jgi:hypothetical protein
MAKKQMTELFEVAKKHPDGSRAYVINLASEDGTNDASGTDTGFLQSRTISSIAVTAPTGITLDSSTNTTKQFTLNVSGGTDGEPYEFQIDVTLSTGMIEPVIVRIPVGRQH